MNGIMIHESPEGEVMAPILSGDTFIHGKPVRIKVTAVGPDKDTPLIIREALVGLEIDTMFSKEQLMRQGDFAMLPNGCRVAYGNVVISALRAANKAEAATALHQIIPGELEFYIFEPGIFEEV